MTKREVQMGDVESFASDNGIPISNVFETSAKDGTHVDDVFEAVARVYDGKSNDFDDDDDNNLVDLTKKTNTTQGNGGCC